MYETMNLEVFEQRREEMLREVGLSRLMKALRAERKRPTASLWASTLAWELMGAGGLIRKFFRTLRRADQDRKAPYSDAFLVIAVAVAISAVACFGCTADGSGKERKTA